MRKLIIPALAAVVLVLTATPPAVAAESLGTILFGRPTEDGIIAIILRPSYRDDERIPSIYRYPSPRTLARAQTEIASSATIRNYLESRNIQPHNVLAIQTAASGGKIIYAR